MKTKIKLLLTISLVFIAVISEAQTWSHGSDAIRTGIPSGGLEGASATNGSLLFYNASNTNTLTINTGTTSSTYSLTLPTTQATAANQVLTNNGSGVLSWTNSGAANIYETSLTLTSAQVLALYSANGNTGYQVVPAPGAGKYIEVISASVIMPTYGGTPYYNSSYPLQIYLTYIGSSGAVDDVALEIGILESTVARIKQFTVGKQGGFSTDIQIAINSALQIRAKYSNPTAGNSDIILKVLYRIVTI